MIVCTAARPADVGIYDNETADNGTRSASIKDMFVINF